MKISVKILVVILLSLIVAFILFSRPIPAKSHADELTYGTSTIESDTITLKAPKSSPVVIVEPIKPVISSSTTLYRIKMCESGGNPNAKNPNSTASGLYQFIHNSWVHYGMEYWGTLVGKDVFSAKDNEELATYVFNKYGTKDWNESKSCWGNY